MELGLVMTCLRSRDVAMLFEYPPIWFVLPGTCEPLVTRPPLQVLPKRFMDTGLPTAVLPMWQQSRQNNIAVSHLVARRERPTPARPPNKERLNTPRLGGGVSARAATTRAHRRFLFDHNPWRDRCGYEMASIFPQWI